MGPDAVGSSRITCRTFDGEADIAAGAATQVLASGDVVPWRTFRWHHGQAHYSGLYWSATTRGHLSYESRLELARLVLADFAPEVHWIVSQPFLVEAEVAGTTRRHVPDFALIDGRGLVTIVNVKAAGRLSDPKVAAALAWAGEAFASRGWVHEVWTGESEVLSLNVRFLAGYRRRDRFDSAVLDPVQGTVADGDRIADAEDRCAAIGSAAVVRPAILHLVWSGAIRADLTDVLSSQTLLERVS